jgi:hypothetical protein
MSGALFSRAKTWVAEILNYTDLNTEFDNILNNLYPEKIDDGSATVAQMQTTTDPYPGAVASLPTSLQGEIQRLRYVIAQITGETYWYIDPDTTIAALYGMMPWLIDIDVFMTPGAQTNWATNTQADAGIIYAGYCISTATRMRKSPGRWCCQQGRGNLRLCISWGMTGEFIRLTWMIRRWKPSMAMRHRLLIMPWLTLSILRSPLREIYSQAQNGYKKRIFIKLLRRNSESPPDPDSVRRKDGKQN